MIIGLTGGAGTGKSFVSGILTEMNYPVIDSDSVTKELLTPGSAMLNSIEAAFGSEYIDEAGVLNRPKLAALVFNDPAALSKLNSITHPATIEEINRRIKKLQKNGSATVFVESAIPFEAGYDKFCDEFWYVTAPLTDRSHRLKESRGYNDEKIKGILDSQKSDEYFIKRCKHVIYNPDSATKRDLEAQLSKLLQGLSIV